MANISVDSLGLQQSIVDDLKSRGINDVPDWVQQFAQHPNFASRGPEVLQKILMPGFAKNARSLSNDMLPPGWTHDINTGIGAVYTEPSNARRGGATYNFPYEFSGYKRGADRETQLPIWGDAERAYAQYAMFNKPMSTHQQGPFYSAEGLMQMAPSLAAIAAPAAIMGAAGAFSPATIAPPSSVAALSGAVPAAESALPSSVAALSGAVPSAGGVAGGATGLDLLANNIPNAISSGFSLGDLAKWAPFAGIGAGAIGEIYGANQMSDAYKDAAKSQAKANENAINAVMDMFNLSREDAMAYIEAGKGDYGLGFLTGGATLNENDPIYQWKQSEAAKYVNQALAARGLYDSRYGVNALADAAMRVSADEAQNQWNRAYNLASLGQNAAAGSGSQAMQAGGDIANIWQGTGSANAASAIGQGNTLANLYSGLGNLPMNAMMMYGYGRQSGLW